MENEQAGMDAFVKIWNELNPLQRRFVVAMQQYPTMKDASEAIGISPNTAYNWPSTVKDAAEFMSNNIALATMGIVQANATKAAMIKAAGLDSSNEKIRQDSATEVLDRVLGKATQRNEVTGKDGEPLRVKFIDYGLDDSSTD